MIYRYTKNLLGVAVFVIAVVLGGSVYLFANSYLNNEALTYFKNDVASISDTIIGEGGLMEYIETLENLRGLFVASKSVERNEWANFLRGSKTSSHFADTNIFAFIKRVSENDAATFLKSVQTDTSTKKEGYPNFAIMPSGSRPEYYVTTYVEPERGNESLLGFDSFSDAGMRATIEKARDTGDFATAPVFKVGKATNITAYLPIYKNGASVRTIEERRAAIDGVVATRINLENLFNSILSKNSAMPENMYLGLYNSPIDSSTTEENIIYRFGQNSNATVQSESVFQEDVPFKLNSINWTLRIVEPSTQHIGSLQKYIPPLAGLGTALIFMLFGGMFLALQISREDALVLAKELSKKLIETERHLIETAPDAIIVLDTNGNISSINAASIKMFGYDPNKIIGEHFTKIGALTEDSVARALSKFAEILNGTPLPPFELRIKQVSGHVLDVEAGASTIRENNRVNGVQVILRNITERKLYEKELADRLIELQKFKLAVESASDHIVITDPEGIVQYANKAAEKITGYPIEEIVGQKAGKIWGGLTPKEFYKDMWATIKTRKQVFVGEMHNKRKNGEEYIALVDIAPVLDDKGEVRFFAAIERDITREKMIDRAKTEFVSLASHQLRTPLTAITWYAEMLLGGDAGEITDKQKQYVTEIYGGGRRLVSLINALLSVSRIELGTFGIEPEPSDIIAICDITLKEISHLAETKHVTIHAHYEKNLSLVNVDKNLIKIVFQNLITNAVEYTKDNGTVTVEIKKQNSDILFSVSDTGIGIPAAAQPKIFEKLFRADNAVETKTDGTGLGLYIVKSIVEAGGGKVWFISKENEGTTFYVTIPLSGMVPKEGSKKLSA